MKIKLLILVFLIINLSCTKETGIQIYTIKDENVPFQKEISLDKVVLDSLLFKSSDIISYDNKRFEFVLSPSVVSKLRNVDLGQIPFCVVQNEEKILAGWFWPCLSSLGMKGFVISECSIPFGKVKLDYCLGSEEYKGEDPRKKFFLSGIVYN